MKPGIVGMLLPVCILVILIQTAKLTEIPKLEQRVDELTVQNAKLEQDLGTTQNALTDRVESYKLLMTQKERLSTELEEKAVHVKKLEANVTTLEADKRKLEGEKNGLEADKRKLEGEKKALQGEVASLKKTKTVSTASGGGDLKEGRVVGSNFQVTWYNDYGKTKSGRFVKDGVTLSVDPSVIKLGTWVKLEFPNGKTLIRRADDTGGAVKGHIVDVYANVSTSELYQRGRTHGVKVTILKKL